MANIKQITIGSTTYPIVPEKLGTATVGASNVPIYLNEGTPKAASVGEAYLTWGGRNLSASYAPIDGAMVGDLGANRLAFVKAGGVVVEYSRDGGTTWIDYEATDDNKIGLFSTKGGGGFNVGKAGAAEQTDFVAHPTNYLLRIKLRTGSTDVYTALNKFLFYVTTDGSQKCWVTLDVRTQQDYEDGVDTWVNRINKMTIAGWPGYNVANISATITYGNIKNSQFGEWRFTFGCDGYNPGTTSDGTYNAYYGLTIYSIFGFGGVGWRCPSTLAKTGHLYSYDVNQNAEFPSKVTAKSLAISAGTNSQFLKADGTTDSTTYTPQTNAGANNLIATLPALTADPSDNVELISSASGGSVNFGRIKFSKLWNYINEKISAAGYTKNTGTYSKPSGGIPKTDLASAVGRLLDMAGASVQGVKLGTTTQTMDANNIITLPAYPTTLPASDVSPWAKAASKPTYTATEVGAYSKSEIDTKIGNVESSLGAINTMLKNMI